MPMETTFPVQAEVLVRHLGGASKTQIATDLRMSRNTITKILEESDIERITSETKSILINALPDSARTIAKAVRKKSQDAWELLDRTGVMPKATEANQNIAIGLNFSEMPSSYAKTEGSSTPQINQSDAETNPVL